MSESTASNSLSIEVYTGGGENPGSFIPFFASLPVQASEDQRAFVAVGDPPLPGRVARFVCVYTE